MANDPGQNLRRLMAELNFTVDDVCHCSGLDKRTVAAILDGSKKPQPRTLNRLATALGVSVDEFFLAPAQLLYRHFDRHTNPVVEEVVQAHPELFEGWTSADFDELHSRRATGGALTTEGALAAVEQMNRSRALHRILSVLLETSQADVIAAVLEALYEQTVARQ